METLFDFICYSCIILSLDIALYGLVVPSFAALLAGIVANLFGLQPAQEILLVVEFTFMLFSILTCLNLEQDFWHKLLGLDAKWRTLLEVRAFYNGLCIAYYVVTLIQNIQNLAEIGKMKDHHLGEKLTFVMGQRIQNFFDYTTWIEPEKNYQSEISDELSSIVAAEFVIIMAQLFSEIARLVYLTTLSNYVNAAIIVNHDLGEINLQQQQNQENNNAGVGAAVAGVGIGVVVNED